MKVIWKSNSLQLVEHNLLLKFKGRIFRLFHRCNMDFPSRVCFGQTLLAFSHILHSTQGETPLFCSTSFVCCTRIVLTGNHVTLLGQAYFLLHPILTTEIIHPWRLSSLFFSSFFILETTEMVDFISDSFFRLYVDVRELPRSFSHDLLLPDLFSICLLRS